MAGGVVPALPFYHPPRPDTLGVRVAL